MRKSLAGKISGPTLSLQIGCSYKFYTSCMANLLYPNLNWVIVYVKIWLFLQLQDNKTFYIAGNKVSGFEKVLNVCKFLLFLQKYEILYIYDNK